MERRGMASSRSEARRYIDDDRVRVSGIGLVKASTLVAPSADIRLVVGDAPFASRAGSKLDGALDHFGVDVGGVRCLDAGASTGGFTDCLLRRGARQVVAVDVGRGQLVTSLADDPRVVVMDRTNIRHVTAEDLGGPVDLVVADLSFISLCTVARALAGVCRDDADVFLLVKPQFEVGPDRVGKGGVVRDRAARADAVRKVAECIGVEGLGAQGVVPARPTGSRGNQEYVLWARMGADRTVGIETLIEAAS